MKNKAFWLIFSIILLAGSAFTQIAPKPPFDSLGRRASDAAAGTCNSARKGYRYYNTTSNVWEFCNGTAWGSLGGGSSFTGGAITTPITAANGTKSLPAYSFTSEASTGVYWRTAGLISFSVSGANDFDFFINSGTPLARVASGGAFVIASGELDATSPDVGIGRVATNVARISNGDNTATEWLQTAGVKRVSSVVNNATATMSNITDLSMTVQSGRKYSGTYSFVAVNSTAAEGIQFDFNGGSATVTSIQFMFVATPPGVTLGTTQSAAIGTALTATTATTTNVVYTVYFDVVVNAGGTLIPRFAEVSHTSGTASVKAGSSSDINDLP